MTFEEFETFQNKLLMEVKDMSNTKGREYAFNEKDRFQNFNDEAKDLELSRLKIAWVLTHKHIRSIISYINKGEVKSNESIRSRIIDVITYLTLIAGMIEEDDKEQERLLKEDLINFTPFNI